jgi:alkylation response protein AidB-like acyl-CoA dehydrogenase
MVAEVEPVVRQYAASAERERRLPPAVMTALVEAGLLRTWVPRALGGLELEPVAALQLFEELSRLDGSVGWVVGNASFIAYACQILPDESAEELFADPRAVVAGAWNPPGTAVPVAGGFRVSGLWPFSSACHAATWLAGLCLVMDGETARVAADGTPVALAVFVKAAEAEILDTWHTLGMRGTGSDDIRVTDVFVPARRSAVMAPWEHPGRAYAGPLYRLGPWVASCQIAVTGLGIARAALEDLLVLATTKTPSYTQTGLADRPVVQDRIARARAWIDAGRSYLYTAVNDAWELAQRGPRLTASTGIPLGLAASFGLEAAVQAVDLVHGVAGTTAIRTEHRFQQYFRDVHTISQHGHASASRFESLGKLLLGRASDWPLHSL